MTLKREIKDAYIEGGNSIYVKTHSNAVYVDENETETLTQRLDNVKSSIAKHTSQLNDNAKIINGSYLNVCCNEYGVVLTPFDVDKSADNSNNWNIIKNLRKVEQDMLLKQQNMIGLSNF